VIVTALTGLWWAARLVYKCQTLAAILLASSAYMLLSGLRGAFPAKVFDASAEQDRPGFALNMQALLLEVDSPDLC
jgi:hypothetical protein